MSYDLDIRSDARYSKALPVTELAAIVAALPGVTKLASTQFVFDRMAAGIYVNLELVDETSAEGSQGAQPEKVNSVGVMVPYPFLEKSGPVALEMAFQIAEKTGWSVFDPQGDCELTRATSGQGLRLQQASKVVAGSVLERAADADASFGELFHQEMWNHSLAGAASVFIAVAVASIWYMLINDWPRARFDSYLPWTLAIGGLLCLWLKGLAQAYLRLRGLRRSAGNEQKA